MSPISRSALEKYLRGECSPEEEKHIRHWFDLNDADQYPPVMGDRGYQQQEEKLWQRLSRSINPGGPARPVRRTILRRSLPYAAAVLLLLAGAYLIGKYSFEKQYLRGTLYATAPGEIRQFSLPDGTAVMLNAMSELRIPADYGEKDRKVYLKGEGYFLVHRDSLAFIVYSNDIATTALGTVFNVSAYADDGETIVSLREGRVAVNRGGEGELQEDRQPMILEPGEEVVWSGTGAFVKNVFDPRKRLGWKDRVLYFEQADLEEVIQKLERYYGVRFTYRELEGAHWKLTGEYRQVPLRDILESLSFNYGIKYAIENDEITLFK